MLHFSRQNRRAEREKKARLRGGLRTDGFMVGSFSAYGRIMVGSFSDRPRILNNISSVFSKFLCDFGRLFFVTGAIFGEFGL